MIKTTNKTQAVASYLAFFVMFYAFMLTTYLLFRNYTANESIVHALVVSAITITLLFVYYRIRERRVKKGKIKEKRVTETPRIVSYLAFFIMFYAAMLTIYLLFWDYSTKGAIISALIVSAIATTLIYIYYLIRGKRVKG